jgi:putative tricarboxylic transport membrane protein
MTFIERPISAGLLLVAVVMLASVLLPKIRRRREDAFQE